MNKGKIIRMIMNQWPFLNCFSRHTFVKIISKVSKCLMEKVKQYDCDQNSTKIKVLRLPQLLC